jgi:hypothetical protein
VALNIDDPIFDEKEILWNVFKKGSPPNKEDGVKDISFA